jgi:hypothetical protein
VPSGSGGDPPALVGRRDQRREQPEVGRVLGVPLDAEGERLGRVLEDLDEAVGGTS